MRNALATLTAFFALAASAAACPTCGIGDRLGAAALLVYGLFMAAPFAVFFGVARYVRKLSR